MFYDKYIKKYSFLSIHLQSIIFKQFYNICHLYGKNMYNMKVIVGLYIQIL